MPDDGTTIRPDARVHRAHELEPVAGADGRDDGVGLYAWHARGDARIHDDLRDRIARHGTIDPATVKVEVRGGRVTLHGTVDTREVKRAVEEIAERLVGAAMVDDLIQLRRAD